MQRVGITYIFLVEAPKSQVFLLFVGQDQLGENDITYSGFGGSQSTLGSSALHIQAIRAPLQRLCLPKCLTRTVPTIRPNPTNWNFHSLSLSRWSTLHGNTLSFAFQAVILKLLVHAH